MPLSILSRYFEQDRIDQPFTCSCGLRISKSRAVFALLPLIFPLRSQLKGSQIELLNE